MDPAKLEALRARYATGKGGEFFDPAFRRVAEGQFSHGDRRVWPFANPATFLAQPFRPEAPDQPGFGGLDVALVGVPMDLGVTNRAGSRLGPRAVRAVERIGPLEVEDFRKLNHPVKRSLRLPQHLLQLDQLRKQRDQLSRETFDIAKQVELARVARRNAEMDEQRWIEMIANRAASSQMAQIPPPPAPAR